MIVFSAAFLVLLLLFLMTNQLFFHDYYISENKQRIQNAVAELEHRYTASEANMTAKEVIRKTGAVVKIYNPQLKSILGNTENPEVGLGQNELRELKRFASENEEGYFKFSDVGGIIEERFVFAKLIGRGDLIVVTRTLGFVGEATKMSNAFMSRAAVMVYLAGLILIFILSSYISKPIIRIKRVSKKMAALEFDEQLEVKRHDELGELMVSVNELAERLSTTMDSLNTTNSQLEVELNKERSLESMRRQFVSDVSHELKNPLSVIIAYANALMEEIPETVQDKNEYYNIISEEASKMNLLVKDLLDLSGYESGVFTLKKELVNLSDLFDDALERFSYLREDKLLHITNTISSNLKVKGDRLRLSQVVTNLLQNAFKYSDQDGEIKLSVSEEHGKITVLIENTGALIPHEVLDKIWSSFYQVDTEKNGNGLGLAIVKSIVQLHDGSVKAYTQDNMNCFVFSLPL